MTDRDELVFRALLALITSPTHEAESFFDAAAKARNIVDAFEWATENCPLGSFTVPAEVVKPLSFKIVEALQIFKLAHNREPNGEESREVVEKMLLLNSRRANNG